MKPGHLTEETSTPGAECNRRGFVKQVLGVAAAARAIGLPGAQEAEAVEVLSHADLNKRRENAYLIRFHYLRPGAWDTR